MRTRKDENEGVISPSLYEAVPRNSDSTALALTAISLEFRLHLDGVIALYDSNDENIVLISKTSFQKFPM